MYYDVIPGLSCSGILLSFIDGILLMIYDELNNRDRVRWMIGEGMVC